MLSGMGRNEEEDRYTAALAITQLSEVLLVQDDGSNASAKFEMKNKVETIEDGYDYKPSVSIESLTLNESPPLDLTLKRKTVVGESSNCAGNFFYSKQSIPNLCTGFTQNVMKGEQNLYQCVGTSCGHDSSYNVIPCNSNNPMRGKVLQCEPFSISSKLNAILIQKPVLGVISVGTNNSFLSQKAAIPENLKQPINAYGAGIGGFDPSVSNLPTFCKMGEASPSSDDDFR